MGLIVTGTDEGACVMRAEIGDKVIVASVQIGAPARTGTIVELRHRDGTPPYVVRWEDGHEGVYFPGQDGRVESGSLDLRTVTLPTRMSGSPSTTTSAPSTSAPAPAADRIKSWVVDVELVERSEETTARAVLRLDDGRPVESRYGRAVRAPHDEDLPLVGDQVAVARALRQLADSLLAEASSTMSDLERKDVILTR